MAIFAPLPWWVSEGGFAPKNSRGNGLVTLRFLALWVTFDRGSTPGYLLWGIFLGIFY